MRITEIRKELLDKYEWLIYNQEIDLNTWESDFLDNVGEQLDADDGWLTDSQIDKLNEIYEKYQ